MPNFIANISLIFTKYPMLDRFQVARDHGFNGVEILNPYETIPAALAQAAQSADCPIQLINTPFGGEWGHCADPDNETAFRNDLTRAITYATALNVSHIHVMSGINGDLETLVQNLIWATQTYPNQSFLIEPINTFDIPDYKLNNFDDALTILERINAPNLGLQFDTYHASRIAHTANILPIFETCKPWIKHIQISGNPNRTEPDQGIVDHAEFFSHIDAWDYTGMIGAEYRPATNQFDWMKLSR